jgi:hypothetical protein
MKGFVYSGPGLQAAGSAALKVLIEMPVTP